MRKRIHDLPSGSLLLSLSSSSPQHHFLAELRWSSCPGLLSSEGYTAQSPQEAAHGTWLLNSCPLLSPHSTRVTKLQRHLGCMGREKYALEYFFFFNLVCWSSQFMLWIASFSTSETQGEVTYCQT